MGPLALLSLAVLCAGAGAARVPALEVLGDSGLCETCLVGMRILEDALCDQDSVQFVVDLAKKELCPVTPDAEQCSELADALLPVAMEWLRASATPASLCAAVGVCGNTMLGDAGWDKPAVRLSDGLQCPLCKHVVDTVKRTAAAADAAATGPLSAAELSASALSACRQLPGELAAACASEVDKRGSLLRMAVGAASDRDSSQACELLGMCVAGLTRFRLPPLGPGLVAALAAAREDVGPAAGRLAAATQQPALRDNRCDACKMMVLEVHTLISNPDFQTSLTTYAEAACDTTAPPAYAAFCKSTVDAYVPLVMGALQQYVQPDPVCQRLHLCAAPSVWQELLGALRVGSFGMLGRVQG